MTKDNSVATKKSITMRQVNTICIRQSFLCCDKHSSICQDRGRFYVAIEENHVATQNSKQVMKDKKILSRQRNFMSRQTEHEDEVNSVATKTGIVRTKVEKNYKKNVTTQKIMLRHNKELEAKPSVATKEYYVTTIKVVE